MSGRIRKRYREVMMVVGSSALIYYVLVKASTMDVVSTISSLDPVVYSAMFFVFLFNVLLSSLRWKLLLRVQGIDAGLVELYQYYLIGSLSTLFLPSSVSGDLIKVNKITNEYTKQKIEGVNATMFDRFLGFVALVVILVVAFPFSPFGEEVALGVIIVSVITMLLFVTGFLVVNRGMRLVPLSDDLVERYRIDGMIRLATATGEYVRAPVRLALALLLSIVFHLLGVLNYFLAFTAIGVDVPFRSLLVAVPTLRFLTALPLSVGGIGVREAGLLAFLSPVGIDASEVLSFSVVSYSVSLIITLLVLVTFFLKKAYDMIVDVRFPD